MAKTYFGSKQWVIYKITSPTGRVYIGVTGDPKRRQRDYSKLKMNNQTALNRSVKKYGWDSHTFEIIDTFISDEHYALGKEIFWIRSWMSNVGKFPEQRGLNMTDGGRGHLGKPMSEETKEKLRQANLGKKYSDETKKKLSEMRKGKKIKSGWTEEKRQMMRDKKLNNPYRHTEEAKRKISESSKGRKHMLGKKQSPETIEKKRLALTGRKLASRGRMSDEHRKKISNGLIGKKRTEEQKIRFSAAQIKNKGKSVLQINMNGEVVKEYPAMSVAAKEIGVDRYVMKYAIKSPIRKINGFTFKYKG